MISKTGCFTRVATATIGVFLLALAGHAPAGSGTAADAGELDPTFGSGGTGQITVDFASNWDAGRRVIVQPDGKYLVAGGGLENVLVDASGAVSTMRAITFILRYLPDGHPDTTFNGTGRRIFGDANDTAGMSLNDALLQPDGKIVLVGARPGASLVTRLNADGSTDQSFGNGGQFVIAASVPGIEPYIGAIAMIPDARILLAGSEGRDDGWGGTAYSRPFTLRLLPNGQPDPSYGAGGRVSHDNVADDLVPLRLAVQASGMITVLGGDFYSLRPAMVIRLNGDGTPDMSFGNGGKYTASISGYAASELRDLLVAADGGVVVVGQSSWRPEMPESIAIAIRLTQSGQPDPAFGDAGLAVLPGFAHALGIAQQNDGKLLIGGDAFAPDPTSRALVARLTPGGKLDATFAAAGVATVPNAVANAVAIDAGGRIVVAGAIAPGKPESLAPDAEDFMLARLIGGVGSGDASTPPPGALLEAVEYFHKDFEHYFLTANLLEIEKLDSGTLVGWWRTGQRYRVYADAGTDRAPVCRFYTGAFASKPSHFYTASPAECERVKQLPEWIFEGVVFHVSVPDASGKCAQGSTPIFRLYNDGDGGAPNHAYTPDETRRQRLVLAGWVDEGTAWCAPLASAEPAAQTMLLASSTWELPYDSSYGIGLLRTTFADELTLPASARYVYQPLDLPDPRATIFHAKDGPGLWSGFASFEPLTGRFLIAGSTGFYLGDVWELDGATGPTSAGCYFEVMPNRDPRDASRVHPFQPVLWSGCKRVVARRL